MNILYLSRLSGNPCAGITYSVPAQVIAQSKFDSVFWYNLTDAKCTEWTKTNYHNLQDFPTKRLHQLPVPFDHPDLAIVECVYSHPFSSMIYDLYRLGIPYIIVPRCHLTEGAQQRKRLKKWLGNLCYFSWMTRHARAIHYLTEAECTESGEKWNRNSFVIPNGINMPDKRKQTFCAQGIKMTYIGRLERYQKGLDLLVDSVAMIKDQLRQNKVCIDLYGPDRDNTQQVLDQKINENGISDLIHIHPPVVDDEKEKVLIDTDVFIMTSRFEGLPMGMLEALAYGLPCVATYGTNLSNEIDEYGAGWTAENSIESITQALLCVIGDVNQIPRMSENALCLAQMYSWDKIAEHSASVYREMLVQS